MLNSYELGINCNKIVIFLKIFVYFWTLVGTVLTIGTNADGGDACKHKLL